MVRGFSGTLRLDEHPMNHLRASLRIGYAVASPSVLSPLSVVLTPWGVNGLAPQAALAALRRAVISRCTSPDSRYVADVSTRRRVCCSRRLPARRSPFLAASVRC